MKVILGLAQGLAAAMDDRDVLNSRLSVLRCKRHRVVVDQQGPYIPINGVYLPDDSTEPLQCLEGPSVYILHQGFKILFRLAKGGQEFSLPSFPGIASVSLRGQDSICAVVMRCSDGVIFFAVVYTYQQLLQLQAECFPDWPDDVAAIQSKAQLPDASAQTAFRVVGNEAAYFIMSYHIAGGIQIAFTAAPEH